ncbi:uncharacterized protein LOC120721259 [Simochromis diagramma]|uniref:uncharacterized protein LOC120721259 n=1 Tax=Simochromis diagramma TaxID=43689 RepID=UPI001A7F068A|nr:uncharacterized protein LOC120721259 [Simochromis diagramma]
MKVHLFGAVSSPSCANYALQRTADDNAQQFPAEVVDTVKRNFYVDDCLKSVASEEEAEHMVNRLTDICAKGGFKLSKWISNSRTVLMSIPEERRAKEIKDLDLDTDQLPVERALGLQWCIATDKFQFRTSLQDRPTTRRGILSVVSSLYDPLGILSPFSMPAKLLLQELCRQNLKWDEVIPHSLSQRWRDWLEDLQLISKFKVKRCIKPNCFGRPDRAQLHHFSDASQDGKSTHAVKTKTKYWILNANSAARKIISRCITCRRNRGKFVEQKMADLPEERVLPDIAPFTNVGVDYFGPISVKRGRSLLKRRYSSKRIMDDGESLKCKPGCKRLGAFCETTNKDQCFGKASDKTYFATGSLIVKKILNEN